MTQSFVDSAKPTGFETKVERDLNTREGLESDLDLVFEVVLDVGRVEVADNCRNAAKQTLDG